MVAVYLALPAATPAEAADGAQPTSGMFVGWNDEFGDLSQVAAFSTVEFNGVDVRLPAGPTPFLTRQGLVVSWGAGGQFDSVELGGPTVLFDQGFYKMWYFGSNGGSWSIGYATSADGVTWSKQGVVLAPTLPSEGFSVAYPEVVKVGGEFWMYYGASDGTYRIHAANSSDGISWTKRGVVLDVGSPGSLDGATVYEPSVAVLGGVYYLWYTGLNNANNSRSIFLATSSDGLAWVKQGRVMAPGPLGGPDALGVQDPSVRVVGTTFEMVYASVDSAVRLRLSRATSADGVSWQKRGVILDLSSPGEDSVLTSPFLHPEPDGSWKVYYHARGSAFRIYLAVKPRLPGLGWVRSVPISIPVGLEWAWFNQSRVVDPESWLNVTVRDGGSMAAIPGLENLTAGAVDLGSVSPLSSPSLVVEAWFVGNGTTPILESWEILWADRAGPTFAGLATATDLGTGGAVQLTWSAAADPSGPVTYSVYQAMGPSPFDFMTPAHTTANASSVLTGLIDGTVYRYVVRATDAWGTQEMNVVERSVTPTTPVDSTPPVFAGLAEAADARTGGTVDLAWAPAVDPDTPESNADPSSPIVYLVFAVESGGSFNFASPANYTQGLAASVMGLVDGVSYDFLVRARDGVGNTEVNLVVRTATPTTPLDVAAPSFSGIESVSDLGTGESVLFSWPAATDPDTPASNTDPTLPITYSVFFSDNSSMLGSGQPSRTVTSTTIVVSGLLPGRSYYVLVRASDAAGNVDGNTKIILFQVQPLPAVFPWWLILLLALLAVLAILAVAFFVWRRRTRDAEPLPRDV